MKYLHLFAIVFVITILTVHVYAERETGVKFKEFSLGAGMASVKEILAAEYAGSSSRMLPQTNILEVQFKDQDIETLQLSFDDSDMLYNIRVSMGKKSNSVFNSKLLNHLESKYGTTTRIEDKTGGSVWKFYWNLSSGKYSVTATLFTSQELVVEYSETAAAERMRIKADNINFAEFRYIYARPADPAKPGTFSYLDFTLGESIDQVRSIVQKNYPAAKEVKTENECRCQSGNELKYELNRMGPGGDGAVNRSELVFGFDTARRLCEIKVKRGDKSPAYVAGVIHYLTGIYGPPSYLSANSNTAQWEFESKRYLLAVSFTDTFNISFLDIEVITRCNNENESKILRDF